MKNIDDFKVFVRSKPWLVSYVNKGEITWQKFYDMWNLYGTDNEIWDKYGKTEETKKDGGSLSDITGFLKNIDMNTIRNGINGIQKAIGLFQEISSKDKSTETGSTREPYSPRPIFRRFED